MTAPDTSLTYTNYDGVRREVEDCEMTVDKAGRYWLWSGLLQHNLSMKAKSREDCLLDALDSALFTISLRNERIAELKRIADLAKEFADQIKPDEDHHES